ncbi:DUF2971 domain-containing protein [Nitrosomonas supralitoralis]|uniref:DUF2971 domain-containing protein n=1 Tax=Nitrosomonas supralitoralis TaxID=2116706 RepID=A0A2P7NRF7_9PROT|nr:DUF2971 domain-containing protein [Nitrosomonas supralitoralis]PSJ16019.1 hypothetical protein C7H79_15820 [Nitrosomonas supralitoralis]
MEYPNKLYKYVATERIDILKNQLIRFTQASALNDPFELQPMFDALFSENALEDAMNFPFAYIEEALRRQYLKFSSKQKSQISIDQLIANVRDNPQVLEKIREEIKPSLRTMVSNFSPKAKEMFIETFQTIGILSLSETINHPLLWAHYSSAHKGFAIEFDTKHKFFHRRRSDTDQLFHLRKVRYANRSSVGRSLSDLDDEDLLATKETSWAYEAEWRMIVPLNEADSVLSIEDEKIYLYTIPLSAISGIIIGARANSLFYEEIKTHLQSMDYQHITLKKAILDPTNQSIQVD